jgi:glutathione S-transferase
MLQVSADGRYFAMTIDFYYGSGSPYAWRVWLALEHKSLPYALKLMSFDAGDLQKPEFLAINPRHKVPAIVDQGFALYESAAIVEYLDARYPSSGQSLFPLDLQQRAIARRLICETDQYVLHAMEGLVEQVLFKPVAEFDAAGIASARAAFAEEMQRFESYAPAAGFLAGQAGAVDFTLYPMLALGLRMERKKPDLDIRGTIPPRLSAWMQRVEALPYFERTLPPHWKKN